MISACSHSFSKMGIGSYLASYLDTVQRSSYGIKTAMLATICAVVITVYKVLFRREEDADNQLFDLEIRHSTHCDCELSVDQDEYIVSDSSSDTPGVLYQSRAEDYKHEPKLEKKIKQLIEGAKLQQVNQIRVCYDLVDQTLDIIIGKIAGMIRLNTHVIFEIKKFVDREYYPLYDFPLKGKALGGKCQKVWDVFKKNYPNCPYPYRVGIFSRKGIPLAYWKPNQEGGFEEVEALIPNKSGTLIAELDSNKTICIYKDGKETESLYLPRKCKMVGGMWIAAHHSIHFVALFSRFCIHAARPLEARSWKFIHCLDDFRLAEISDRDSAENIICSVLRPPVLIQG